MADLDRRDALRALAAGATTLVWGRPARGAGAPPSAPSRVRAGARVTLTCPGASAFELSLGTHGVALIDAIDGTVTFRVPVLDDEDASAGEWTCLRCTPLRGGHAIDTPRLIDVLTAPVSFGT